ncbi:MAG TPA: hypothetical protein VJ438_00550, partial [Candidatus Nanoarchaeia archaeon]|nr:hypothetical protein [Candidatus Nanoarchaeia archaeon]
AGKSKGLTVLDDNGKILEGWPQDEDEYFFYEVSVGDLDRDGDLELVPTGYGGPYTRIFHHNGEDFSHDNRLHVGFLEESSLLVDVDGDNEIEIVGKVESPPWKKFRATRLDTGNMIGLDKFPMYSTGSANSFIIDDIDNDGKIEIVDVWDSLEIYTFKEQSGKFNNYVYVWDLDTPFNKEFSPWTRFRHDSRNTARYEEYEEKEKSRIVNTKSENLEGNLKMILQKKSEDIWIDKKIVLDKKIIIPGGTFIDLGSGKGSNNNQIFVGWNDLGVLADEGGKYRIYVYFKDKSTVIEKSFEFNVCMPKTCSELRKNCGKWDNLCSDVLNCGNCGEGESCKNGVC